MKAFLSLLMIFVCISCSDKSEFFSIESFNDEFSNGLFMSKLKRNNIPYQSDYHMGEHYVLVHFSFKEVIIRLRADTVREAKSLALINLDDKCSQKNLSQQLTDMHVFNMTLTKRDVPMIRVSSKVHSSENVTALLSSDEWRCF